MRVAAVTVPGTGRFRVPWQRIAGGAAVLAGTALRVSRLPARSLPSLAGAGLVAYGAAMVYEPAGVILGGVLLMLFGREINQAP